MVDPMVEVYMSSKMALHFNTPLEKPTSKYFKILKLNVYYTEGVFDWLTNYLSENILQNTFKSTQIFWLGRIDPDSF
jgi:hypothetical protein